MLKLVDALERGTIVPSAVSNHDVRTWVCGETSAWAGGTLKTKVLSASVRFGMSTFDLVGASAPRPLPRWLPPTGGLLAAGGIAALVCGLPPFHSLSLAELIASAVARVLQVFLATAVTVWSLCAIQSRTIGFDTRRLVMRTSLDALWFAPLVLLLRENSAWAAVVAAVLVASVVKLFHFVRDRPQPADSEESLVLGPNRNPFRALESSPTFWRQASGAGAALCAQTGALAALGGYPFTGALLVGTSSAVWSWCFATEVAPYNRDSPSASSRTLFVAAVAIMFTAASLIRYLQYSYGIRGWYIASGYHARYAPSQGGQRGQLEREKTSDVSPAAASAGDPGVILWPEKRTHTQLVAPAPAIGNSLLTSHRSAKPLVIPFDGVYWFFKAPDAHPPRTSRQAHGSPETLDIRSTDRRPLSMEAHENLGSMIALDCCSRIQIAIRNADHYPETVSLELVLINTSVPERPSQSLGSMMVRSTRPWSLYGEKSTPVSETLNFAIPGKTALRRFDEVRIVFRIDSARADAGPKIAIDHLVLVPRGL
jgi:hypothetical protein